MKQNESKGQFAKLLNGQWPIFLFVVFFLIIPLSTLQLFDRMFEFIFGVLAVLTLVMAGLLIASVTTTSLNRNINRNKGDSETNE